MRKTSRKLHLIENRSVDFSPTCELIDYNQRVNPLVARMFCGGFDTDYRPPQPPSENSVAEVLGKRIEATDYIQGKSIPLPL
jgi:hypothetical protein